MGEEPAPEQVDDENRENAADCGRQSQQSLSRTEVLNDTVEQQLESRGVRVGYDTLVQDLHRELKELCLQLSSSSFQSDWLSKPQSRSTVPSRRMRDNAKMVGRFPGHRSFMVRPPDAGKRRITRRGYSARSQARFYPVL